VCRELSGVCVPSVRMIARFCDPRQPTTNDECGRSTARSSAPRPFPCQARSAERMRKKSTSDAFRKHAQLFHPLPHCAMPLRRCNEASSAYMASRLWQPMLRTGAARRAVDKDRAALLYTAHVAARCRCGASAPFEASTDTGDRTSDLGRRWELRRFSRVTGERGRLRPGLFDR
jgi:hypothetical protein